MFSLSVKVTRAGQILTSTGDNYMAKVTGACRTLTSSGCRCYCITKLTAADNLQSEIVPLRNS